MLAALVLALAAPVVVPIAVRGYPAPLSNGMNDPADWYGFTRDGEGLGYCTNLRAGDGPPASFCEVLARDGSKKRFTRGAEMTALVRDNGFARVVPRLDPLTRTPPPLVGSWRFADLTIVVEPGEASPGHPVYLKVGGAVGAEKPVFVLTFTSTDFGGASHFAVMNGMALSPDGEDLGMVGHFFAMEWADAFEIRRVPLRELARKIYNDTGYRHHRAGDFAGAAALFAKAHDAEPTAELPSYNLACARARLGDLAGARAALADAVREAGAESGADAAEAVRRRAAADPDLAPLR